MVLLTSLSPFSYVVSITSSLEERRDQNNCEIRDTSQAPRAKVFNAQGTDEFPTNNY